jgi:hypothetical protein
MKLSTGKIIKANAGTIGLDDDLNVFEGYDGRLRCQSDELAYGEEPDDFPDALTGAEAVELADAMIARWTAFREKHKA